MNTSSPQHLIPLLFILLQVACKTTSPEVNEADKAVFARALENGVLANQGFVRCNNYMNAWLSHADAETRLVPRTLDKDTDIWNANDCAADNFPFLVLTSFFTDTAKYYGVMREMLENEIKFTSRVGSLPDTYSFSKKDFLYDSVSMPRVVFGTTEYIKDGLLPITEWLGATPWSDRMLTLLEDLDRHVDVAGGFGRGTFGNAPDDEVNGELLQILSRVYWMTGDEKYLDWAIDIAEHFLTEAYPLNSDYLRLRDHGCEIVSGLCELYVTTTFASPEKRDKFREPLYRLLDHVLEHGRNNDGLFFNAFNPRTGEAIEPNLADTWGYTLNGFYAVYMVDSVQPYYDAVTKVFGNLHQYHNYNWENLGADGYADAIEGALNLYNRIPDRRAAQWIDKEIRVMWSMQDSSHRSAAQRWRDSGIIEGWYGDGNFARTSIMYNLWKSKGTWAQPWAPGLQLGAEMKGDTLYLALRSDVKWDGKLFFDKPRHTANLKLPIDWARINQFPEWYTVTPDEKYDVLEPGYDSREMTGDMLLKGMVLTLQPGTVKHIMVLRR